jgi:transposase-like protein
VGRLGAALSGLPEGAKFWHSVLTQLRNRGLADVLIACCDGLTGLPEATRMGSSLRAKPVGSAACADCHS